MLKSWSIHADYQQFLISNLSSFYKTFPKRVVEFESSKSKLYCLDLDILFEILKPYYSNKGSPVTLQPEIFRSFSLMLFLQEASITNWVNKLHNDDLLANCIRCNHGKTPSIGAHYYFISKLWGTDLALDRINQKKLHHYKKKPSKIKSPFKNNKQPSKRLGVVQRISDSYSKNRTFSRRSENLLQTISTIVAVEPSFKLNLIRKDNLTLPGDYTSVHSHASYYDTKVCDCRDKSIYNCKCTRRLYDIDATWGWDSHENS
ncbi:hypothetical protein J2Z44_004330 [Clostridium punense]|uniref:Uncharacterized protein n=1 Tax=Clostridium punense TaxID=1054297 RepID=A0ABS4KB29_9CLOT|nr:MULTISPECIES: hypothetical protein [Clostridium]EQB88983.1 hypothetical protein M918_22415 [Clostridium sp. BL8]MBP2024456.1 hypothetical protein [Clostridium punense]